MIEAMSRRASDNFATSSTKHFFLCELFFTTKTYKKLNAKFFCGCGSVSLLLFFSLCRLLLKLVNCLCLLGYHYSVGIDCLQRCKKIIFEFFHRSQPCLVEFLPFMRCFCNFICSFNVCNEFSRRLFHTNFDCLSALTGRLLRLLRSWRF